MLFAATLDRRSLTVAGSPDLLHTLRRTFYVFGCHAGSSYSYSALHSRVATRSVVEVACVLLWC